MDIRVKHWLPITALFLGGSAYAQVKPVEYKSIRSGNVSYHAVIAHVRTGRVAVEAVGSTKFKSASTIIRSKKPVAALTGTFFNTRSAFPVGDILVNGSLVGEGNRGSVLAVDWFGDVKVFDIKHNTEFNWFRYQYALRGTVRIISGGKVAPNPRAQKFKDPRIMGRASRTAAGITKNGDVVFMATKSNVYLRDIGNAMRKLGVVDAVSLDGGSSTCLYYRGSYKAAPGRSLTNMLLIYELSPEEGEWAQYPIRRRHTGPASYVVTCPTKYWPVSASKSSATPRLPVQAPGSQSGTGNGQKKKVQK
jgi:hypothetical protein